ncbi:MAG: 6-carboxytetrahydropterin synthase QueD [Clostridia bacterium]|nr:6-carboxytetrahydropterin synthase QueD [Clostridia bacterium]
MYYIKSEHSFDSAHFLAHYQGKCSNIHGHRWRVLVEVGSQTLHTEGQLEGMVVDFSQLKKDVKDQVDFFDHALIIEKNTMKATTVSALTEEGFRLIEVDFRPTAEQFAKHFYDGMTSRGYQVRAVTVYETPNNSASYEGEDHA